MPRISPCPTTDLIQFLLPNVIHSYYGVIFPLYSVVQYWSSFFSAIFFALYITLVCCEGVRRKHPTNIILLSLFVSMTHNFFKDNIFFPYSCKLLCNLLRIISKNIKGEVVIVQKYKLALFCREFFTDS